MSIRITELDAITSLQSGDYIAVDNESTGTHKFDALNIGSNIGQNIANTYSSSASYAIGQYCLYDNNLYKCTTTISTPEAWNSSHWIQVTVGEGLYEKVDKVSGKGLSTNDFTNEYKQKLGGIEAGAEVNVQADWTENDSSKDDYIKNKPGNATTSASGFMSASDKQKLDNIEAGAEVNVQPNWAEDDSSKDDYIKNKPTIDTALSASSDNAVRNSAITAGINQVQGNLDTEITNRQNAVSGEQLARENADSALDGRLDTVEEILPNKANINGSYEEMTVGSAEQLISTESIEDTTLYTFRASDGGMDIGDRENDKLVGGTVAWNQLVKNGDFSNGTTNWGVDSGTITASDNVCAVTVSALVNAQGLYQGGIPVTNGHKYLLTADFKFPYSNVVVVERIGSVMGIWVGYYSGSADTWCTLSTIRAATADLGSGAFELDVDARTQFAVNDVYYVRNAMVIDLTQMFGSTIADALYAMEQAESGSGVAWFKKYFPKPYYAYDSGSLQSVNVASHDMTGFNQWDEEWEVGAYTANGTASIVNDRIRSKNKIPVLPNTTYYFKTGNTAQFMTKLFFDADENPLQTSVSTYQDNSNKTFTTPSNAYYMLWYGSSAYGNTYNHDICINRVWTGNRNGEYEPYELHSYAYDESVELRGAPSFVNGELVYDGDTYEADGTVNRKYDIVDLGTLNWRQDDRLWFAFELPAIFRNNYKKCICNRLTVGTYADAQNNPKESEWYFSGAGYLEVYVPNATSSADVRSAMNGTVMVYPLATPTSEQATGFTNPQVVDAFGTEEYVDAGVKNGTRDVSIPVGHVTQYMANLRDKLQHLPNLAKEDGDYFVNQTGTQMKLKKVEGYYEDLVSGMADNLTTKIRANDQTPYLFRTSGGSVDIGDREYINGIVGGTVAWNQLVDGLQNFVNTETDTRATLQLIIKRGVGTSAPSAYANTFVATGQRSAIFNNAESGTGFYMYHNGSTRNIEMKLISGFTWNANHKYVLDFYLTSNDPTTVGGLAIKNFMLIDLTLALGSTIADYIYSLEQATAGAGVAFFKSLFPKPYYAYNAGELMSVKGLVSHDMVGFNAFDKNTMLVDGYYINDNNGEALEGATSKCTDYIPIVGGQSYYIKSEQDSGQWAAWYDADKNFISGVTGYYNLVKTAPQNARYIRLTIVRNGSGNPDTFCINLSWDGSEDGNYEPYEKHSYALDSDLELRGIPKLDASNNLYYGGDVYESDGTVTRKYGIVDLGTLTWFRDTSFTNPILYAALPADAAGNVSGGRDAVCAKYSQYVSPANWWQNIGNKEFVAQASGVSSATRIWVRDDSYTDASTFATAMSGEKFVYELATPTTETADPYTSPQIVNDFGTEEWVLDSDVFPMPVGHNTDYPINLKSKLEMAPDSPDGDGDYIVRQTNGTNEYVPLIIEDQLPAVPSTDGTYTLTVTIASGEATYSWT